MTSLHLNFKCQGYDSLYLFIIFCKTLAQLYGFFKTICDKFKA
jgi:hypothetical protein